jgi:hypothetical protein
MISKSAFAAAFSVALLGSSPAAVAAETLSPKSVTHAAFFSAESKQPEVIDPQAFVADPRRPKPSVRRVSSRRRDTDPPRAGRTPSRRQLTRRTVARSASTSASG